MIEVTKYDLGVLFSKANANFRDLSQNDMDMQQFVALCWTKAVMAEYAPEVELTFPERLLEYPEEG